MEIVQVPTFEAKRLLLQLLCRRGQPVEHLSRQTLDNLLRGELARSQVALAVRHLLTKCPECRELARTAYLEHPMSRVDRAAA